MRGRPKHMTQTEKSTPGCSQSPLVAMPTAGRASKVASYPHLSALAGFSWVFVSWSHCTFDSDWSQITEPLKAIMHVICTATSQCLGQLSGLKKMKQTKTGGNILSSQSFGGHVHGENKHSKKGEPPPCITVSSIVSPLLSLNRAFCLQNNQPTFCLQPTCKQRREGGTHIHFLCISIICSLLQWIKRKCMVIALPFIPS